MTVRYLGGQMFYIKVSSEAHLHLTLEQVETGALDN